MNSILALEAQLAEMIDQRDTRAAQVAELQAQLVKANDERDRLVADRQALADENELGLLQLHQMQEELDYHFTRAQDLEERIREMESAPRRRGACHSAAVSWSSLVATAVKEQDGGREITLTAAEIRQGERRWPSLTFKLAERDNQPALEFRPDPGGAGVDYVHWPEGMRDKFGPYLVIGPKADLLARLSSSDWYLVRGVASALVDEFARGLIQPGGVVAANELKTGYPVACRLATRLNRMPHRLRFDAVALREEWKLEGYVHLWFEFRNLSFGDDCRPRYEFKLAVNGSACDGLFGNTAHIEFRTLSGGEPPLFAWPPPTTDDFGPKFQIKIDLKTHQIDRPTWSGWLLPADSDFVNALMVDLPDIIHALAALRCPISRPWEDWAAIAAAISLSAASLSAADTVLPPEAVEQGIINEGAPLTAPVTEKKPDPSEDAKPEKPPALPVLFRAGPVTLTENLVLDGYAHLALHIDGADGPGRQPFTVKLLALKLNYNFDSALAGLEFRPDAQGRVPLQAWPPSTQDQYGFFLRIDESILTNVITRTELLDTFTESDQFFLDDLLRRLPDWLAQRTEDEYQVAPEWGFWKELATRLLEVFDAASNGDMAPSHRQETPQETTASRDT